jgi:hypothetical protein
MGLKMKRKMATVNDPINATRVAMRGLVPPSAVCGLPFQAIIPAAHFHFRYFCVYF